MKNMKLLMSSMILALAAISFSACNDDDDALSAEEQRIQDLTATWQVDMVTNDNNDVTSQYTGFILTVTGDQTYTTQNGGNAWPQSGTWTLNEADLDQILRSDGVTVTIEKITAEELDLSFSVDTLPGGRAEGITGEFLFELIKQN